VKIDNKFKAKFEPGQEVWMKTGSGEYPEDYGPCVVDRVFWDEHHGCFYYLLLGGSGCLPESRLR